VILIHGAFRLTEDWDIEDVAFHFQLKTFFPRGDLGAENMTDIPYGLSDKNIIVKGHEE